MSGWARARPRQSQGHDSEQAADQRGSGRQGRGNGAAVQQMFSEQEYGILGRSGVQRAIDRNNASHMTHLPRILEAFHLAPREAYDAEVVNRIAEFQQNFGRREDARGIDGVVGPTTLALLDSYYDTRDAGEVDTSALWPAPDASTEDQFAHYSQLAAAFGHTPAEGEPLIIGIRGVMEFSDNSHADRRINAYDDTFVVLLRNQDGVGVWTFAGATHAYQAASGLSPNADGRGGGDVGSVRPTHEGQSYMLERRGNYKGKTSMGLRSDPTEWGAANTPDWWALGHVPMERDTNQDRRLSATERRNSQNRRTNRRGGHDANRQTLNGLGDYGTVTWMHPGLSETSSSGRPFASIGCLTAREEDLENLSGLSQQTGSDIRMIIVEAPEAARRMGRVRPQRAAGE